MTLPSLYCEQEQVRQPKMYMGLTATFEERWHKLCTLLVADSGSRMPPTDLLGAVSFSTKTLSNSGINRFDIENWFY